jgi:hypothetical protein
MDDEWKLLAPYRGYHVYTREGQDRQWAYSLMKKSAGALLTTGPGNDAEGGFASETAAVETARKEILRRQALLDAAAG